MVIRDGASTHSKRTRSHPARERNDRQSRPPLGILKDYNVVILLLESFSSEDVGVASGYPGYTPFLDELSKKSYFFKYNFAI